MRAGILLYMCAVVTNAADWQLNRAAAQAEVSSSTIEVQYFIHETPTDPNSPVEFCVTLSLQEKDSDGNTIGWDITSIEILQVGDSSDTVWVNDDPNVPTQDGLWWVEHADITDPQADEFTMPPYLGGTADAQYPDDADLEYKFEGQTYTPPPAPEQAPYDITGALDWRFAVVGDEDPVSGGEDEPVEVPPTDDPWEPS